MRKILLLLLSISIPVLFCSCTESSSYKDYNIKTTEYTDMVLSCFSANEFADDAVSNSIVETILKAGTKAPSAQNAQPCRFTVIRNTEIKNEILPDVSDACVLFVVSAPMVNQAGASGDLSAGLATESMFIAAQAAGLGARIYTGPVAKINLSLKERLSIAEDYEAVTLLCVGYVPNMADAVSGASPRNPLSDSVKYID